MGKRKNDAQAPAVADQAEASADTATADVGGAAAGGGADQSAAEQPSAVEETAIPATAAVGADDDAKAGEKGVLTDGQEKGPDVQGAEGAAAQGAGDTDGQAERGEPAVQDDQGKDLAEDHARSWRFDVAELARATAGGARLFANGGLAVDYENVFDREEATIMADFVRDNPDAPVEAMFIHLSLKKRYPRTEPNNADMLVLSLFHAACVAAFKFEQQAAAVKAAAEFAAAPAASWPGERAFEPEKPVFSPSGFSPR